MFWDFLMAYLLCMLCTWKKKYALIAFKLFVPWSKANEQNILNKTRCRKDFMHGSFAKIRISK